jgi:hypothetical protein
MALKFHISMSLDGCITGPDPRDDVPLGDGGGVPSFGPTTRRLEQIRVIPSDGVTHITYR